MCTYPPMKMEQTECSETLAYKIQTPGNYPEESTQHSEHIESLKSRKLRLFIVVSEHFQRIYCFLYIVILSSSLLTESHDTSRLISVTSHLLGTSKWRILKQRQ
jgi:hypothetical protein